MFSVRSLTALLFVFIIMLAIVWPIPNELLPFHRNFLLYSSFVFTLGLVIKNSVRPSFWQGHIRWISIILLALTVLGLITGLLFSPDVKLMFKHWNSMWVRPVMLFFLGLYIYPVLKHSFTSLTPEKFISIIVLCFCVSPILHILNIVWIWYKTGVIEWGETVLFRTRTELSIQINMVAVMLVAEALRRVLKFQPALVFSHRLLGSLIALVVFATMLANTRFGTLGFAAGMMSMLFLVLAKELSRKNMGKMLSGLALLVVVISSLAYTSWKTDPRWTTMIEDVQVGWNAPLNASCFELDDYYTTAFPLKRADGSEVNGSNACRPAYIHQALELIKDHPQGNGASKDIYGHLLRDKFSNNRITISQSHSGLLEFALQYGIAGLLLWLSFNVIIIRQAWRSYTRENDAISLFLLIFTIGFLSRSVVDRNLIDHFFEQFMFVTGVLLSITWIKDHQKK
ncbi:O-antigen ligase family protein [Erwinia sp. V71]|uniref:O-antigen ligase family protein n=1 Tax=Erwinia sp. V71 TaxID=3369424 RepID=UPI003F5DDB3D